MAVKVRPHGVFGYRQRPGAVFPYAHGRSASANAEGFRGPLVSRPKQNGTVRVVLLGESTTYGYGVNDNETIDAYLRADLQAAMPTSRVDVVNLAFDGYDAYQIWQRLLTDGVPLQPDVIVLNTGINDVRNSLVAPPLRDPDPRTLLWEAELSRLREEERSGGPRPWTRVKHWLFLARVPGIVREKARSRREGPPPPPQPHPEAVMNFELNVSRAADVARRLGVALIVSTPPSVLLDPLAPADMKPRSYWIGEDRAATQAYRDTLAAHLLTVAARRASAGEPVTYQAHHLAPTLFLDDCHLTPSGNQQMARDFASLLVPILARR